MARFRKQQQLQTSRSRSPLKPAVPVKKSVMPDFIICLEDGKKFKSLKRHLRTHYNMTPEEYRESGIWRLTIRWSLRTTLRRGLNLRRRWASVNSASARSNLSDYEPADLKAALERPFLCPTDCKGQMPRATACLNRETTRLLGRSFLSCIKVVIELIHASEL
jgi:hypothetical protein